MSKVGVHFPTGLREMRKNGVGETKVRSAVIHEALTSVLGRG